MAAAVAHLTAQTVSRKPEMAALAAHPAAAERVAAVASTQSQTAATAAKALVVKFG